MKVSYIKKDIKFTYKTELRRHVQVVLPEGQVTFERGVSGYLSRRMRTTFTSCARARHDTQRSAER